MMDYEAKKALKEKKKEQKHDGSSTPYYWPATRQITTEPDQKDQKKPYQRKSKPPKYRYESSTYGDIVRELQAIKKEQKKILKYVRQGNLSQEQYEHMMVVLKGIEAKLDKELRRLK